MLAFEGTAPSGGAPAWRKGDVFFCSFPKAGRTWVKQFLAQYISLTFDLGYREDYDLMALMTIVPSEWFLQAYPEAAFTYRDDARVPRVRFSHLAFHDRFVGRPVIFLTRGVEDTLVSCWHHDGCPGPIGEYVRRVLPEYLKWIAGWDVGLAQVERCLPITYEGLWENAKKEFSLILSFIGLPFDSAHFQMALERASFDQMRKDQEGTDYDRVRRGVVGGYKHELSAEDIAFIERGQGNLRDGSI